MDEIQMYVQKYGLSSTNTSVLVTSFCNDKCNIIKNELLSLEHDILNSFYKIYHFGGLAGIPFGGVNELGHFLSNIRIDGDCWFLYGPHIDYYNKYNDGTDTCNICNIGSDTYKCCPSVANASVFVHDDYYNAVQSKKSPITITERQQYFINRLFFLYSDRYRSVSASSTCKDVSTFLDAQTDLIMQIASNACRNKLRANNQRIILLGGIQVNTPAGVCDFFVPSRMSIFEH
jgi:hypothetical protein